MPRHPKSFLHFDVPCADPACVHSAMVRADAMDRSDIMAVCLNHSYLLIECLAGFTGSAGFCLACYGPSSDCVVVADGDWTGTLCRGHAISYIAHALDPRAHRLLLRDARDRADRVHALADSFYVDGHAWQPMCVGCDSAADYIGDMDTLPGFDKDGAYAFQPEDLEQLNKMVSEGFARVTGLDIPDDVAYHMISNMVMVESFGRSDCRVAPLLESHPECERVVSRIYTEVDPQGLVSLHGAESDPYGVNVRDLLNRLVHGQGDLDIALVAVRVAQSFGDFGVAEHDITSKRLMIATRIVDEVLVPLWEEPA